LNCYANSYSNISTAYDMSIVRFFPQKLDSGVTEPQKVNVRQYTDHCKTSNLPAVTAYVGQCTPFIGSLYGLFSLKRRSTACVGAECSTLKMVRHEFFATTSCTGPLTNLYKYPIHRECLQFANGTQEFYASEDMSDRQLAGDSHWGGLALRSDGLGQRQSAAVA
jgi:hypothetical protein